MGYPVSGGKTDRETEEQAKQGKEAGNKGFFRRNDRRNISAGSLGDRRGTSNLVATLTLIAIATVGGTLVFATFRERVGSTTRNAGLRPVGLTGIEMDDELYLSATDISLEEFAEHGAGEENRNPCLSKVAKTYLWLEEKDISEELELQQERLAAF